MLAQELMTAYSPGNPSFLNLMIASAVAFGFGYWVYAYSIILMIREKKSPYPVWMHTFYFACDVTGTVFWFLLARQHDWFWFFSACSVAMAIWVVCEIWSLYMAVKHERQEAFGDLYKEPVTERQAVNRIMGMILWSFCIVNLMNYLLGGLEDAAMFKWYVWTNLIVAVGPTDLWARRKNRQGTRIGISIMILCSIVADLSAARIRHVDHSVALLQYSLVLFQRYRGDRVCRPQPEGRAELRAEASAA